MSAQQTLTMDDADSSMMWGAGTLPTMITCPECDEVMLRSRRRDHRHDTKTYKHLGNPASQDDEDDEEDEDEKVGSWWDITLEYSVTYRFKVPAYTKHQAEEIAKGWKFDARPVDSMHVHTDRREGSDIFESDAPDDWDPYGSEPLHEAMERAKED